MDQHDDATRTSPFRTFPQARFCAVLFAGAALAGCYGDNDKVFHPDTGAEDSTSDTTTTEDAGHDSTTTDAPHDVTAEVANEVGQEVGADVATDTATDAAVTDTLADTGSDAAADVVVDATPDTSSAFTCLALTPEANAIFSAIDPSLCLVAQYDVPDTYIEGMTWGTHGGPMRFETGATDATPSIVRYQIPATQTGSVTIAMQNLNVPGLSTTDSIYWNSQAVDLDFFGWTAFSYSTSASDYAGELLLTDSSGNLTRYAANGMFALSTVPLADGSGGRLVYTGLSTVGTTATTTYPGGVYAADSCGAAGSTASLLPISGSTCTAPVEIGSWQSGSSGGITTDPNGNVFAILSTFGGNQELHGFERSIIARGDDQPVDGGLASNGEAGVGTLGNTIFSLGGYGSELAATGTEIFYQPYTFNGTTSVALDVVGCDYTATAGTITPDAMRTMLTFASPGTEVSLTVDPSHQLWVAVDVPPPALAADAGADAATPSPTHSTFFVFGPRPGTP